MPTKSKTKKPKAKPRKNTFYDDLVKSGPLKKFTPKKVKTLNVSVETITPDQARHILYYYNSKNRKASSTLITKFHTDMLGSNWIQNGQTISFDHNGGLLDGQHRLGAVIKSNIPTQFVVVYGLHPDAFESIDIGKARTNADVLGMKNYQNAGHLSSLIRMVIAYETTNQVDASKTKSFAGANQITVKQIMERIEQESDIVDHVGKYKSPVVSPAISAFCSWALSRVDSVKAEEFLKQAIMGEGIHSGDQTHYIYNKLLRAKHSTAMGMNKTQIIANIFIAWRRFMGMSKHTSTLNISWDEKRHKFPNPTK